MINRQKETILALLKANETNRNYKNKYWFLYKDFLEPIDDFTDLRKIITSSLFMLIH